jgi:hypothetical protein
MDVIDRKIFVYKGSGGEQKDISRWIKGLEINTEKDYQILIWYKHIPEQEFLEPHPMVPNTSEFTLTNLRGKTGKKGFFYYTTEYSKLERIESVIGTPTSEVSPKIKDSEKSSTEEKRIKEGLHCPQCGYQLSIRIE